MASCSSKDDYSSSDDTTKYPVRITAGIKGMDTRSSGDPSQLQNDAFLNGAQIKVYLDRVGSDWFTGLPESGYTTYTLTEGSWTAANDIYITGSSSPIKAFGIYPSKVGDVEITKTTTSFTVSDDQSEDANYRNSDLMYAYTQNNAPLSTTALEFNHCMSKITIIIKPTTEFTETNLISKLGYVDFHVNRIALLSFDDNKITVTGTEAASDYNEVTLGNYGRYNSTICSDGISCVIPPQSVTAGDLLIDLNYDIDCFYKYYVPDGGMEFKPGKEYIFELTLENSSLTLSAPTVKPWEPGTADNIPAIAK